MDLGSRWEERCTIDTVPCVPPTARGQGRREPPRRWRRCAKSGGDRIANGFWWSWCPFLLLKATSATAIAIEMGIIRRSDCQPIHRRAAETQRMILSLDVEGAG